MTNLTPPIPVLGWGTLPLFLTWDHFFIRCQMTCLKIYLTLLIGALNITRAKKLKICPCKCNKYSKILPTALNAQKCDTYRKVSHIPGSSTSLTVSLDEAKFSIKTSFSRFTFLSSMMSWKILWQVQFQDPCLCEFWRQYCQIISNVQ